MSLADRDAQLLGVFDPQDRQALEETVDEILHNEVPVFDVLQVIALSTQFERAAQGRAEDQKLVSLALAALLRERVREALALALPGPGDAKNRLH